MAETSRDYERRWWTLGVLCLSLVMIVVANASLNVALPTLVRDLHASSSSLQWIVDAYSLVFAGLLLTMGALGDRYGRRLALNGGLVVFGIYLVIHLMSNQTFNPSSGVSLIDLVRKQPGVRTLALISALVSLIMALSGIVLLRRGRQGVGRDSWLISRV